MPTYQYACTDADCGNRFELVQSFTDPSASECPVCHGPVRKVFSSVGVVFKGSGFYRNDSRADAGKPTSEGSDGGSSEKSDKSSDKSAKTDSGAAAAKNGSDGAKSGGDKGSSSSNSSSNSSSTSSNSSSSSSSKAAASA